MIQTDSSEKRRNHDNETDTSEREVIEELVASIGKRGLDIVYPDDICRNLHKSRDIEYPSMNVIEDDEKNEIHEWKCKHKSSIGKALGNSREKEKKAENGK